MKKLITLLMISVFALSLSACAGVSQKGEQARVKCPACGYEFEAPVERH
jgi:hypothetical protein